MNGDTAATGTRKLAAIMFTDIVGFSRQMGANETRTLRVLEVHNQLIQQTVATHHGHVIKTMGDAFLPNKVDGYVTLGSILYVAGRPEESIELTEKAMRLNPRYPPSYLQNLNFAYRLAGRYEEAIVPAKKLLVLNPNFMPAHLQLASCYAHLGRLEEARAEVAEVLRLAPYFSLEEIKQNLPFKDPAVLEREIEAWRKAGLK